MGVTRRQVVLFGGTLLSVGLLHKGVFGQNASQIRTLLKAITLRVITPGPSGSGVLVGQSGTTYLFLTAKHVLDNASLGEEVYVLTSDGKQHAVEISTSQKATSADLALASFTSSNTYNVARLGNSSLMQELDSIFVAGFPLATIGVPNPIIKISRGEIEQVGKQSDGYALGYSANTQPGMSGGPVLNEQGELIAIHGRADGERIGNVRVKQGSNWAVPINTAISTFALNKLAVATPRSPLQTTTERQVPQGAKTLNFEVVTVNNRGKITTRKRHSAQYLQEELGNGVVLDMILIPEGTFSMGSPSSELESYESERPQHNVIVPAFSMGRYSVTQAQWQAIMGSNPSQFKGDRRPVENVSWDDAVEFCEKLSALMGRKYRLPSESEWEYACRAGTTSPFHFGPTMTTDLVNFNGTGTYAQSPQGTYRNQTTKVGLFPPNSFGLYDMHGNVWEWCLDHLHDDYRGAPSDGSAWVTGGNNEYRIGRGGSWINPPAVCRSAVRFRTEPLTRDGRIGFRVVSPLS